MSRPRRVLHLLRTLDPESGGPLAYVDAVVAASRGLALSHSVASFFGQGPALAGTIEAYAPRTAAQRFAGMGLVRWLAAHVADYDVVHVHGVFSLPLLAGAMACRSRRVPYVVSPHGNLYPWSLSQGRAPKAPYLNLVGNRLLRGSARLVATTDAEVTILQSRALEVPVALVPPGIPVLERAPERTHAEGPLKLVFLGRLAPQKGLPVLLRSLPILQQQGIDVRLALVGSGDPGYEAGLRALVAELGLGDIATFTGFLQGEARDAALAAADVFALPSHMENFSFATAEALAAGLPAVVSSEVGLAGCIARHDCGAVVPPDDPGALAAALARYRDPALRIRQSALAHRCARKELSLERMGSALCDLYGAGS